MAQRNQAVHPEQGAAQEAPRPIGGPGHYVVLGPRGFAELLDPAGPRQEFARGVKIPSVRRDTIKIDRDLGEHGFRISVYQPCPWPQR